MNDNQSAKITFFSSSLSRSDNVVQKKRLIRHFSFFPMRALDSSPPPPRRLFSSGKKNSPVSLISLKIYKKKDASERRNGTTSDWVEQRSHTKDDETKKKVRRFFCLEHSWWKMTFDERKERRCMLIMIIIFPVSNQGLVRVLSDILIGCWRKRKEKRKKRRRWPFLSVSLAEEKQINRFILQIPSSFSRLLAFFLSLSLFLVSQENSRLSDPHRYS